MYDPSDLKPLLYLPLPKERPNGYIAPCGNGQVWCDDRQRMLNAEEVAELFEQMGDDSLKGLQA